uniref:Growth/differentiation factor 10 n=1 Tax=Cynoglossus semilaevis TaxID=244447 RepID=A0A3P8VHL2_CYNSE
RQRLFVLSVCSTMMLTHLCLLTLSFFFGAASVKVSAQDRHLQPLDEDLDQDMVSQHMAKLYEKYNNRENRLREGNTVRSVKAIQGVTVYRLNLTALQDSEAVLSATFHFLLERRPRQKPWFCKRFKSPSCRSLGVQPSISLLFRSVSSGSEVSTGSTGSLLGNVTFHPHRRGVWQMKDVTQVIKEAWDKGQRLLSVELDLGQQNQRKPEEALSVGNPPYLLLHADDQALAEPNSVAASLQRYDPFAEAGEESSQTLHRPNSSSQSKERVRREAALPFDLIQNNELPEVEYKPDGFRKDDLWESTWYLKPKSKERVGKKEEKRKSHEDKSPVLSFDEQTMRNARRKQWSTGQNRGCSRRNLRVDFADIGWSEWVIAPKAFEAYYCAGTCEFPMPKMSRPSNHATIQSIVRAVGIIPGVPEPCCVPEKMSPLAVLYRDEASDLVLKVYPNMSIQSCSCR